MTSFSGSLKAVVGSFRANRAAQVAVRAVLTVLLLAWVALSVDMQSVSELISRAQGGWLVLGFGVYLLGMESAVWRWQMLLAGLKIRQPLVALTRIFFVSCFFSMFLPSSIGGDVARMVLLKPEEAQREDVVSSVLMDRLLGLAVILVGGLGAALALPLVREQGNVMATLLLFCGLFLLGLLVLASRGLLSRLSQLVPATLRARLAGPVVRVYNSLASFQQCPKAMLGAVIASVVLQIATCVSVFFAGLAFGVQANMLVYFALIPIGLAVTTLPISINGLGVQDQAMLLLFAAVGVPATQAIALSLYMHLLRNAVGLIGAGWFVISRER